MLHDLLLIYLFFLLILGGGIESCIIDAGENI